MRAVCTWGIISLLVATGYCAAPVPQPTTQGLFTKELVQKAFAHLEKEVADANADFSKKVEALRVEKQKKIEESKLNAISTLRLAVTVANASKLTEEVAAIKGMINDLKPANELVGDWLEENGSVRLRLNSDGVAKCLYGEGVWTIKNGIIEVRWSSQKVFDTIEKNKEGKWYIRSGCETSMAITPP